MSTYTVAVYLCDRAYGGPEEGGWWFDTGKLVRSIRRFRSEDMAYAFCRRMNDLLRVTVNKNRRDISSVLSEGQYWAEVHESDPPAYYPETKPYYS